jgi:hypothetical protein
MKRYLLLLKEEYLCLFGEEVKKDYRESRWLGKIAWCLVYAFCFICIPVFVLVDINEHNRQPKN